VAIQTGREDVFPFGNPKCWYVVVYVKEGKLKWMSIPNSYEGSLITLAHICCVLSRKRLFPHRAVVLGVWTGRNNTDLFLLDPEKTLKELERRGVRCCMREVLEYWAQELS